MGIYSRRVYSLRDIAVKFLIMYLNSRKSAEANEIVKEFNGFDVIVHNCLISANLKGGNLDKARKLFDEMPERNEVLWTALISGFMRYGKVEESMWYFERNPYQNVVSWTAAICGFVQNGFSFEGLKLFLKLLESGVRPNKVTFTSVIRACAELGDFKLGMSILGLIVKTGLERNVSVSNSNPFVKNKEQQERLREASLSCTDKQMQSYILYGVGYHNGGLCLKDRNLIEGLFLKGDIQILCTTNTLAHGINLPAHTVVIKSTQYLYVYCFSLLLYW
ncbi:hypothetical protein K2173_014304 [Erythroxylum novogranatense]|uniref:Helicase C-terminal domain-containing protein n=1 Tax=Erythroxylum novogranatense TaxID=1862640 RepID=A0AAV8SEC7_9ROSI|nr:hypothetical protein K2173_014304 [Erythroxylum novogranatense]